MSKKTGLGRGIGALFSENEIEEYDYEDEKSLVKNLKITEIEPNKEQARKIFDEEKLNELAESIKKYGVLQPIIVTKKNNYYEIVAGERRWRASIIAGLNKIPAIIKENNKKDNAKISLIEMGKRPRAKERANKTSRIKHKTIKTPCFFLCPYSCIT